MSDESIAARIERLVAEEEQLRALEASGVEVTAQDVPSARAVPLSEVLEGQSK
jgi:mannose/fructose/N-acetylgalactosamine-specific phosphotransferase system component IIB